MPRLKTLATLNCRGLSKQEILAFAEKYKGYFIGIHYDLECDREFDDGWYEYSTSKESVYDEMIERITRSDSSIFSITVYHRPLTTNS